MNYYKYVHDNVQKELENVDYYNGLRRRRNQHQNHEAKFDSNCAGCRAAYWMKLLHELDQTEAQVDNKPNQMPTSIGLVNVVKTESTPANTSDVKVEAKEENNI